MTRRVAIVLLTVVLSGCPTPAPSSTPAGSAKIVHIIDGDTVVLEVGGARETTRLLGIDTPETHHPTRPVECFGVEATERLAELLPVGSTVRVERDVEARDHYDRLLLYIHLPDDQGLANLVMVADGYATALHVAPNDAHRRAIADAEAEARRAGRGLWGTCGGPGVAIDPLHSR